MQKTIIEAIESHGGRLLARYADGRLGLPSIAGGAPDGDGGDNGAEGGGDGQRAAGATAAGEQASAGGEGGSQDGQDTDAPGGRWLTLEEIDNYPTGEWLETFSAEDREKLTTHAKEEARKAPTQQGDQQGAKGPERGADGRFISRQGQQQGDQVTQGDGGSQRRQGRSLAEIDKAYRENPDSVTAAEYVALERARANQATADRLAEAEDAELDHLFPKLVEQLTGEAVDALQLDPKADKREVELLRGRIERQLNKIEGKIAATHLGPALREMGAELIAVFGGDDDAKAAVSKIPPRNYPRAAFNYGLSLGKREVSGGVGKPPAEDADDTAWQAYLEANPSVKKRMDAIAQAAVQAERTARGYASERMEAASGDPYAGETLEDLERIPTGEWLTLPETERKARLEAARQRERARMAGRN